MRGPQPWRTNRSRALRSRLVCVRQDVVGASQPSTRRAQVRSRVPDRSIHRGFACRPEKLIVEIDGGTHGTEGEIADDRAREAYLEANGYRIFRAHNSEVYEDIDAVCDTLLAFIRGEINGGR